MSRYVTISLIAAAFCAAPFFALTAQDRDETRYSECLDMADRAPDRAINQALVWQGDAGGVPARHCEAVALSRLGDHAEAAIRMEKIAEDMRVGKGMPIRYGKRLVATSPMLADMYGQAANAWLLAEETGRAETAIGIALSLTVEGGSQELILLLDRARIYAADEDYTSSLADLELIQKRDPQRRDLWVLIASAARGVGDYMKALTAIDKYILAYPDDASGHLEHGNLLDAMGKPALARKSWIKVLQLVSEGFDADAARANIERIDVRKSDIIEKPS